MVVVEEVEEVVVMEVTVDETDFGDGSDVVGVDESQGLVASIHWPECAEAVGSKKTPVKLRLSLIDI